MNNTEKLLRALIDALGFDVEEVEMVNKYYSSDAVLPDGTIDSNATPVGVVETIEYKLTSMAERHTKD